ncbi:hypothetical protein EDC01DRAFT_777533 [Geopyxis carbonaria]|nr:hypothetical protein EDC01DRAFT_777533 [Geopyxis carbonaria]
MVVRTTTTTTIPMLRASTPSTKTSAGPSHPEWETQYCATQINDPDFADPALPVPHNVFRLDANRQPFNPPTGTLTHRPVTDPTTGLVSTPPLTTPSENVIPSPRFTLGPLFHDACGQQAPFLLDPSGRVLPAPQSRLKMILPLVAYHLTMNLLV